MLAGAVVMRRRMPGAARARLFLTVAAGVAFGWAQMMRGAHHASHSLWTAWICWAVTVASFHLLRVWRDRDGLDALGVAAMPSPEG